MSVRKICKEKGCRASPRCDHPWWFDLMHGGKRWRMRVDDFAIARGATEPVASKQAAEQLWEPKFLGEIMAGHDPRQRIGIAVLIEDTPIVQGDHGHAPHVPVRLADQDGPLSQHAAGSQHRDLICSRGNRDGSDANPWAIDPEHVELMGLRRCRGHTAEGSSVIGPHHVRVGWNKANGVAVRVVNRTVHDRGVGAAPEE